MNTYKSIIRLASCLILLLPFLLQSCESDRDSLFDKYYDFPESVNVEYGQTFEIAKLKLSDGVPVIPADAAGLSYSPEEEGIVRKEYHTDEFTAIGMGSTIIRIYNNRDELIREIPVTVRSPFEFADMPDDTINLKCGEIFNIFKPNENTQYNISSLYDFSTSNFNVAVVGYQGDIRAYSLGTAVITVSYNKGNRDVVKRITVNVVPTLTLNMKSGESIDLKTMLTPEQLGSTFRSEDTQIAAISGTTVYARKPGTTILKDNSISNKGTLVVNVSEGSLKELCNLSWLHSSSIVVSDIETAMKGYNCTLNEERKINGYTYQVLEYRPYGNATTITFYCSKAYSYTPRLDYAIIETGQKSEDVLGWLYNNYQFVTYGYVQPQFFELGGGYWQIYPVDKSWSTLRIE